MVIGLIGNTFHIKQLKKLYEQKGIKCIMIDSANIKKLPRLPRLLKYIKITRLILKCDVIYGVSIGHVFLLWLTSKFLRKKTVNHWIGTDVLNVLENEEIRKKAKKAQKYIDKNISGSFLLRDELQSIGISSEVIPLVPNDISFDLAKMPDEHKILVYLPNDKEEFYGSNIIIQLAKEFPNLKFIIVANDGAKLPDLPNLEFRGRVSAKEMNDIYNDISILIRIPKHDGMSLMILEALAKGKNVIYKYNFPYCLQAETYEEVKNQLCRIINKPCEINIDGHNYIKNNFNKDKIVDKLIEVYKFLLITR